MIKVEIRKEGLDSLTKTLENNNNELQECFEEWGNIYIDFLTDRFEIYSLGGGDWAPLRPSTIKSKKRKGSALPAAILRDTDKMFGSIGERIEAKKDGCEVMVFSGRKRYPNGMSLQDVVMMHDQGAGLLPQRKILVPADKDATQKMTEVLVKTLEEAIDG